jgi:hypothetical protein
MSGVVAKRDPPDALAATPDPKRARTQHNALTVSGQNNKSGPVRVIKSRAPPPSRALIASRPKQACMGWLSFIAQELAYLASMQRSCATPREVDI